MSQLLWLNENNMRMLKKSHNVLRTINQLNNRKSVTLLFGKRKHTEVENDESRGKEATSANESQSFIAFEEMLIQRQREAQRSVAVEISGPKQAAKLHALCSQFGDVKNMFYYFSSPKAEVKNVCLVEFENMEALQNMSNSAQFNQKENFLPASSQFFKLTAKTFHDVPTDGDLPLHVAASLSAEELAQLLMESSDMSQQILHFYLETRLTDLDYRLRFLTCLQVENMLRSIFPNLTVFPFGSSVNSFGRRNCDLDMLAELNDVNFQSSSKNKNAFLMFLPKADILSAGSDMMKRNCLKIFGDALKYFAPGCTKVVKILEARVPIIKYKQDVTGLECDLSLNNRSGLYMSELLYLYGKMDGRVAPLVFAIRHWAHARNLTRESPGRWVTNFSVTLMVLFYLMNTNPPVVPNLKQLIAMARPEDKRITDGTDCTFLRDINLLQPTQNTEELQELIFGFFSFYSHYNLFDLGLSMYTGKPVAKPPNYSLFIENPLEGHLNVSQNVSLEEVEKLKSEVVLALRISSELPVKKSTGSWGLLRLLSASSKRGRGINLKEVFSPKMKDL